MERVFTLKKRCLFPALLFVFIAIIFTIGCTNHLLKPHQSDLSILVKLEKSSGRNITTGDYQITTWIENRDGTESHHQEINSTAGADASIIFEELAIGSEINIHLEVVETGTTGKKLVGTSDWITVNEGSNVVVIVLREDSDTGEIDGPVAGDDPEDEGDPVLSRFDVQYDSNQYQLVNTNIDLSKITITEYYYNADTGTSVKASEVSNDYIISFADSVDTSNAIGYLPAYVEYKHDSTIEKKEFIIPIKYALDANNLTISGDASVEQNEELKLTAEYKVDGKDSYNLYTSASSSSSYKIIENVNISWQGATKQQNAWEAMAETSNAGTGKTATVTLTPKDDWCVTTSGVEKSHSYEVTEPAPSYDPTVGLSWADSTLTIYNEAGLINFRKIVNGDVSSSAPITVGDKTFSGQDRTVNARLAADIALTEESWTPIANNSTYPYAGTFDGAGHTVSGINVEGGGNPKGFFGSIGTNKAIIKNLTVEGTVDVSYYAGGIAGYVDGGTIEYCVNKINVTSTAAGGTGGIAGYIASSGATITGCVNFGAVQGNNYAGGIAGSSYSNSTTSPKIAHCINFGSVKTTDSSSKASGIYGFSVKTSDSITNCANFGTITSSNSGSGAGITNTDNYLTIQYCLSAGAINATKIYAVASSTSGTQTKNYYDSSKITQTQSQASGNAGRATSELKAANAWDTSWTTTNWSFAAGRYPVPNIQDNIPPGIWTEIK